ncbi:23S rRNA pseudouridine(2604) synthase RluF [Thalassotalea euphylliae]
MSESGFCSRREADKLIEQQRVTINGNVPELGTKVMPGDKVAVDGKFVAASPDNKSDRIYIAYHKPIGITCTTERHVKGNIIDAIGHKERIFPIGRLDKPSEGLIFLTSDGDIVNKILRAENAHDKEYIVTVDKPLSERFVQRMTRGVPILGTITEPCRVEIISKFVFKIILTQGLNRQIRRMCEYLGYEVKKLKRVRIMNIDLTGLKVGQWRNLTEQELAEINTAVKGSRKTSAKAEVEQRHIKPNSPKVGAVNNKASSANKGGNKLSDKQTNETHKKRDIDKSDSRFRKDNESEPRSKGSSSRKSTGRSEQVDGKNRKPQPSSNTYRIDNKVLKKPKPDGNKLSLKK